MIISCPECNLNVSDKALQCPHCGYPMSRNIVVKPRSKNKRRRLPNGFGQISKVNYQNIRKPYRAQISIGKKENGRPIVRNLKPIAYFETYNEAYEALLEYNRNPYDLDADVTMSELYEKWLEEYEKALNSNSSIRTVKAAWGYCSDIYNMRVKEIRARHIKGCINDGKSLVRGEYKESSPNMKSRIKSILNLMLDYAVEYELADKNYARTFNLSDDIVKDIDSQYRGHIPFTDDELNILWSHKYEYYVQIILFQCYTGWRPQELCELKISNIDIENWTITGGMKTDAGTNRIVPVHDKIKEIVLENYKNGSEYLFTCKDTNTRSKKLTYDKYRRRVEMVVKKYNLNPDHRAHDARVTFVTKAKKYNVNEYAIKRIIGHTITDLTEKTYTKRDIDWLREEMQKIKE